MLSTNLEHISTEQELRDTLANNPNVMVCCGRMGPMCIPVYEVMERIRGGYPHVAFRDLEFDAPHSRFIRELPECRNFRGLPFTVYFKDGKVVKATGGIQTRDQVTEILSKEFAVAQEH